MKFTHEILGISRKSLYNKVDEVSKDINEYTYDLESRVIIEKLKEL